MADKPGNRQPHRHHHPYYYHLLLLLQLLLLAGRRVIRLGVEDAFVPLCTPRRYPLRDHDDEKTVASVEALWVVVDKAETTCHPDPSPQRGGKIRDDGDGGGGGDADGCLPPRFQMGESPPPQPPRQQVVVVVVGAASGPKPPAWTPLSWRYHYHPPPPPGTVSTAARLPGVNGLHLTLDGRAEIQGWSLGPAMEAPCESRSWKAMAMVKVKEAVTVLAPLLLPLVAVWCSHSHFHRFVSWVSLVRVPPPPSLSDPAGAVSCEKDSLLRTRTRSSSSSLRSGGEKMAKRTKSSWKKKKHSNPSSRRRVVAQGETAGRVSKAPRHDYDCHYH